MRARMARSTGGSRPTAAPQQPPLGVPVEGTIGRSSGDRAEESSDDAAVVRRVLDGCKDDFAVLVGRYNARIHQYVAVKMLDGSSVDDVVQKSFVTAFQQLAGYDPRWPFEDWLRGIARNHCRNEWRQHLRRVRLTGRLLEIKRTEWEVAALGGDDVDGDRLDALRACLDRLADFDRRVLLLRFVEHLSIKSIGERLGMSGPVVRQLLSRLRQRLAECVRRRLSLEQKEET